jgi:hypothetical protein
MRPLNYWNISILLFALAIPGSMYAGSGGSKSWFHLHQGKSSAPQHQNIHPVVKHSAAKHPKPSHTKSLHAQSSKRNKHS